MIGKKIQQLRKKKNYSLTELSERAGVAKSYLSSIERGIQQNPSIQFLEKVGAVLGIPVEEFLQPEQRRGSAEQTDQEWDELVQEAMRSGISKREFRDFLEYNKWKMERR
ncbi:HTH-type transcriptional regulator SinR [compost metagenome]|uniref:Transcriptional regulator n=1 Tax=Paenibacillus stellifer TaxID=169760 RepID=A0A089LR88_9BACL|nr:MULTISPECIES: helix-turn-helix domain-containing protein [Paenibacillus]AIQ62615.1 transcriptional regulator [Paenibacillus stellifer]MBY9079023.1 helix-turn-helix domain-containing protein [Paenibacillus sp. CGMCC 1.18879]MBY9087599.1 helix-turn-helix domain-containing protein [Paenibacillus sinensis]